jgi:hypothetical protein
LSDAVAKEYGMADRSNNAAPRAAWWREPMMWLVLGGPLMVVIASFVTLALAVKHPDPVLASEATEQSGGAQAADFRTGQAERGSAALVPALQARNHAATGGR